MSKTHIIEVGNYNAVFGWNSIEWTHEVEMTEEVLNSVIQATNAVETFPCQWSYKSTENSIIYLRIKQK